MTEKPYVSYLPAKLHKASEPSTIRSSYESVVELRRHPFSNEAEERLNILAVIPDEDTDLQEMPEMTQHDFARAIRGYLPVAETQVGLWLDEEVKAWLVEENQAGSRKLNHILRREMHHQQKVQKYRTGPFPLDLAKAS